MWQNQNKDVAMDNTLAQEFEIALRGLYHTIVAETNAKYKPTLLMKMIDEIGGVLSAKNLISREKPSDGYIRLWELKKLHLTLEAFVLDNPKWHPLFTVEELQKATVRLKQYANANSVLSKNY